jgi:uncharacterized membrane protein
MLLERNRQIAKSLKVILYGFLIDRKEKDAPPRKAAKAHGTQHAKGCHVRGTGGSAFTSVRSGGVRSQAIEQVHGTVHSLTALRRMIGGHGTRLPTLCKINQARMNYRRARRMKTKLELK